MKLNIILISLLLGLLSVGTLSEAYRPVDDAEYDDANDESDTSEMGLNSDGEDDIDAQMMAVLDNDDDEQVFPQRISEIPSEEVERRLLKNPELRAMLAKSSHAKGVLHSFGYGVRNWWRGVRSKAAGWARRVGGRRRRGGYHGKKK